MDKPVIEKDDLVYSKQSEHLYMVDKVDETGADLITPCGDVMHVDSLEDFVLYSKGCQ